MRRPSVVVAAIALLLAASALARLLIENPGSAPTRGLAYVDRGQIWFADLNGAHPRCLTSGENALVSPDGENALVSPDGRSVIFSSGYREIYLVASAGGEARRIFDDGALIQNVVWAPDSRLLAVGSTLALYIVDTATGYTKKINDSFPKNALPGYGYAPSFSPDSRSLVYQARHGSGTDLAVMDLNSGKTRLITHTLESSDPVWGPHQIALSSLRGIWLIDPDGEHLHDLGGNSVVSEEYGDPVMWSADGKLLLTESSIFTGFGSVDIFQAVDVPSGKIRLSGNGDPLGVSHDDRVLLVSNCRSAGQLSAVTDGIETLPLDGGKPGHPIRSKGVCEASWTG